MNDILNNPDAFRAALWIPLHVVGWLTAAVSFCVVWWWARRATVVHSKMEDWRQEYCDLVGVGIASILLRVLFVAVMIGLSFSCVEQIVTVRFPPKAEAPAE